MDKRNWILEMKVFLPPLMNEFEMFGAKAKKAVEESEVITWPR